ncbi:MAG: hypothetical protein IT368_09875 [Candidatus Hydrogenedentes bacterium]|nr:hypothetical protein [Candidatus Hydrogenedentota bacterium]
MSVSLKKNRWSALCTGAKGACVMVVLAFVPVCAPGQEFPPAPVYPAPYVDALADPVATPAPLRLAGLDLVQSGTILDDPAPALDSMQTLRLVAQWIPNLYLQTKMPLSLKFWSHDGKISRDLELQAGPEAAGTSWEPDRVYRQEYEVSLLPVAEAFSGDSYLTLGFPSAQANVPLRPLQALPVKISPRVGGRDVAVDRYTEIFGQQWRSLQKSFRLGNRAELTLPIMADPGSSVKGIGLVSAFSYGTLPQGAAVCRIVVRDAGGTEQVLTVQSGIATAKFDYDYHGAGVMAHKKVAVADSVEADYLSADGAPFMKHKYAAVLALPQPVSAPVSISFEAISDVIYDVYDVVLLY